ncbi:MAG: acyl-ACP--UDP-N-acetylglucosamine O-acyltransferase [Chlamydiia bacterium]|nr:acyl-ACP--UDP-N-acetylglucosamine O-acyltransferase [Chlamydiia bacterium]
MTKTTIHPTAVVEEGATLGAGVTIEPYAIVKGTVTLGEDVTVKSHAYIDGYTTIGAETVIYPSAVIGVKTQDRKFRGEKTYVRIGKRCEIREFVTINASCGEETAVVVGDECLIMAYCHIAHNCSVGNRVVMSNNATLAGHVIVEDHAIIGGYTPIHQYNRVGCHAMVGGFSRVPGDVPPYTIGGGIPFKMGGINLVGLKRHGFSLEVRQELSKAFKLLYRSGHPPEKALNLIEREVKDIPEVRHLVAFCRQTERGLSDVGGVTQQE